jgi:nucleoside-diphosphate-sugar epimerase
VNWTVLGASGVIGRRLVGRLRTAGEDVHTPARNDPGVYTRPLGHVIYAIGLTADFRQRPYDTVQAHVGLLAEMLRRADFDSLLYLSSTRVYARAALGREDAPLPVLAQDPSDLYNLSKLMGESLCLHGGRHGVRVARLSNVVGGDDADSDNFVPSLVRAARSGRIVLQTAPDSAKDYIHIDDVVELLPRIAVAGRERIYNVASGVQLRHADWTQQLATLTGCTVDVAPGAPVQHFVPIDISRIRAEFGFAPRPALAVLASAPTTSIHQVSP